MAIESAMLNTLDLSLKENNQTKLKKELEFLCWFNECVSLSKDGGELGIQFVHGSLDVFFFIIISSLLSYSGISICRERVKIIIFTELSDGKFHADGGVNWAHTKVSFHSVIKKIHRVIYLETWNLVVGCRKLSFGDHCIRRNDLFRLRSAAL